MEMKYRQAECSIKNLGEDDDAGTFEAIVSVFGNIDSYGDVMMPGAFRRTLAEWEASEKNTPVLWMHETHTPAIGVVLEAAEVDGTEGAPPGLWVKARLFIDEAPIARQIWAGMKAKAQNEFSFGYFERDARSMTEDDVTFNAVFDVDLFEISPVFRGANPATVLLDAKSDPLRDGNVSLSDSYHRRLRMLPERLS